MQKLVGKKSYLTIFLSRTYSRLKNPCQDRLKSSQYAITIHYDEKDKEKKLPENFLN